MFDAELYQKSKEVVDELDDKLIDQIERTNLDFALRTIKKYLNKGTIGKEGVLNFSIKSNGEFDESVEHRIFMSIISSGFMKNLEEELCLYLIKNDSVMSYPIPYNTLEFIWDAKSYFVKNMTVNEEKRITGIGL